MYSPDGAHFGQLEDCLVAVVDALREQLGELLVVEDFETAAGRDLTHGGRMEAVVVVTVARLHEYGRVGETFRVNLATDVVQVHAWNTGTETVRDSNRVYEVPSSLKHTTVNEIWLSSAMFDAFREKFRIQDITKCKSSIWSEHAKMRLSSSGKYK